ncbi:MULTISPECIES: hypothetical protein [unclassified Crossiella]|uniref:hypothetical protein n=1 Tax=unclassified Crossiella TaxID=2620835 RepID=UPI001FFF1D0D|nr:MULTISPECIES: hypothetical protein [unclassified Crossiella]MCK2242178.1 hypothetical protein [Crossiella sp. S99.2]MCK2256081.1 hypothetical protein [Crossiella sp. S99.1]
MIHPDPHPLAATTAQAVVRAVVGTDPHRLTVHVEDWADRVLGRSWMAAAGNPPALNYSLRAAWARLPVDDDVLYVHAATRTGPALLIHVSELATTTDEGAQP